MTGSLLTEARFLTFVVALATHITDTQPQQPYVRTRMTHCRQSAVRHHRGSAAVAICGAEIHDRGNVAKELSAVRHHRGSAAVAECGAEIHDRGNLQLCERAILGVKGDVNCLQWLAEKLAMGACSLMPILRQAWSRQRLTSPASKQPPQPTKQGATLLLPPVCAQNRTRTYTSLNTRT